MKLNEGDKVVSAAKIIEKDEEDECQIENKKDN